LQTTFEPRDLVLRDGRHVRVRAVLPSDDEEILQAFDHLSPQARYTRFMTTVQNANVERLRERLASFPAKGLAIAATVPASDGIDIVGTASFMVVAEGGACEFAISIVDDWGGAGLGRQLMEALIDAARRRGLARMHGFVLSTNRAMLRLAERLGFAVNADPDDFSIRIVTLAL
jgi:RimJ/RimL family protein N-acetyltransferase